MFLIRDSIESRHGRILEFNSEGESSIALLLAVIDLERTLRRAILALGSTPTSELNARMGTRSPNRNADVGLIGYRSNIDGLHQAWKDEIQPRLKRRLPHDLAPRWDEVKKACSLRNELVHGSRGPTTRDFASNRIRAVLELTRNVHDFALEQGHDLSKPVRRRLKERIR